MRNKYIEINIPTSGSDVSRGFAEFVLRFSTEYLKAYFPDGVDEVRIPTEAFVELMLDIDWELVSVYHSYANKYPTYCFKRKL